MNEQPGGGLRRIRSFLTADSGQSLILVAISLIALIGVVALAIEAGNLYAERRHMQNAADAAALEAARSRCYDNTSPTVASEFGRAFAMNNYARVTNASVVPQAGGWEFQANAREEANTFFAGIFGVPTVTVEATARAACGITDRACGLFPIAFSEELWNPIAGMCGKTFYVWTSANDKTNASDESDVAPSCDQCDCDLDLNSPGLEVFTGASRAWLDFTSASSAINPDHCSSSNGCGAAELKCWVLGDSPVELKENTCVPGDTGDKLGVRVDVNQRIGDYVNIPLFSGSCTPPAASGTNDCSGGFRITSFGCVQVQRWTNQPVTLPWKAGVTPPQGSNPNVCWKGQLMPAKVGCRGCATDCGRTAHGEDPGSAVKAVSLIQ